MERLGCRWLRCTFNWRLLEPKQGSYPWDNVDYVVSQAVARGIDILGVIADCPSWANGGRPFYPPSDLGAWVSFTYRLMEHYYPVTTWEIWNEPDIGFWQPRPNPAEYMALVKATPKLPGRKLLMGGLAAAHSSFLEDCLKRGLANYVNGIAYHPYACNLPMSFLDALFRRHDPKEATALKLLADIKALVAKYTSKPMEYWLTEFGYTTGGLWPWETVTEQQQAGYLARTCQCYKGLADAVFVFDLWEMADDIWSVNHHGLLRHNWTEKPAFAACKAFLANR